MSLDLDGLSGGCATTGGKWGWGWSLLHLSVSVPHGMLFALLPVEWEWSKRKKSSGLDRKKKGGSIRKRSSYDYEAATARASVAVPSAFSNET
eukprot:scaffold36577_cov45-Cyclotella_meneghiniana.AAC.2